MIISSNDSLEKIKAILRNHKEEIFKKYSVREIGIFGSYIRGAETKESDLDILVDFQKPIDLFSFLELEEFLSDLCKCKIDLVSKKTLKPYIGKQILSEVIYL
ncbi:MAG TPA: nucleotidyltransferase family protein [Leptospiraceae bacterium]|nr:nucleotidyltransferase family protein [Leptospiraceae bacterium]HMX33792.1 nucleotidyltransferase family protein [Leptospiraceae bacterium]HMY32815.1 nucleotidyltransferase family protein [Leptospiraceae bacterium]HMZ67528.1 nucleotidyltransferase family protein [Leptospiraceae bacterium]HNA08155.1 nucleotidyltransferase family protein [Leptospiraceae bacterium]